jgi:hypothetical protein
MSLGDVRVARQTLLVTPAGGEQLHRQLDRDARTSHHRLPAQEVNDDAVGQRHMGSVHGTLYMLTDGWPKCNLCEREMNFP